MTHTVWLIRYRAFNPLSAAPQNGHTQTICRLLPTNCLSVFDHFVRLAHTELIHLTYKLLFFLFSH